MIISKKMKFSIPHQSTVAAYMKEKKGWPDDFCAYYAEKFWNNYNSSGWKLKGGNAMKSWQSAFTAQWQNPKFKEDIEMLQRCLAPKAILKKGTNDGSIDIRYANEVFEDYKKHPTSVPRERLTCLYDWLKENKLIRLSKEQIQLIRSSYGEDPMRGKAVSVEMFFDNLANSSLNLLQIGK